MKPELGNSTYQINKERIINIVFPDASHSLQNIELQGNTLVVYYTASDADNFIIDNNTYIKAYDLDAYKIKFPYKETTSIQRVEFRKVVQANTEVHHIDTQQLNQYINNEIGEEVKAKVNEFIKNKNELKNKIRKYQINDRLLKENHLSLSTENYKQEKETLEPIFTKVGRKYFVESAVDQLENLLRTQNIVFYDNYGLEKKREKQISNFKAKSVSEKTLSDFSDFYNENLMEQKNIFFSTTNSDRYSSLPTLGEGIWRFLDVDWRNASNSFNRVNQIAAFFLIVCIHKIEFSINERVDTNELFEVYNKISSELKNKFFRVNKFILISSVKDQIDHYFHYSNRVKDYLISESSTFRTDPPLIPWLEVTKLTTIEKGIFDFLSNKKESAIQTFKDVYDISNCYLALGYLNQKQPNKAKPILNLLQESEKYGDIAKSILAQLDDSLNEMQIIQYLNGELSGNALKDFEKKIANNETLRLKVKQHQSINSLLKENYLYLNNDVYQKQKKELSPIFEKVGKPYFEKKTIEQFDHEILINQYINGELSGDALKAFEKKLAGDEELRLKVEHHQTYDELMKENFRSFENDSLKEEKEHLKPFFDKIGEKYISANKDNSSSRDTQNISIAIAENSQLFLQAIEKILGEKDSIEILFTALNGADLLSKLDNIQPQVVLIDIRMPDIDGLEATRKVKELYPNVYVIILSNYDDLPTVKNTLKAGADGFLLKDFDVDELLIAIDKVSEGKNFLSERVQNLIDRNVTKKKDKSIHLTIASIAYDLGIKAFIEKDYKKAVDYLLPLSSLNMHQNPIRISIIARSYYELDTEYKETTINFFHAFQSYIRMDKFLNSKSKIKYRNYIRVLMKYYLMKHIKTKELDDKEKN